jgi:hypothetical protein
VILTANGEEVKVGDRVFNYYDREWGYISESPSGWPDWFEFTADSGRRCLLNGERVATLDPQHKIADPRNWAVSPRGEV